MNNELSNERDIPGKSLAETRKKFMEDVEGRYLLWLSIIEESNLEEKNKEKLKVILNDCKNTNFDKPADRARFIEPDTLFSYAISRLLDNIDQTDPEQSAVFENLKDDIWKFAEEIKS